MTVRMLVLLLACGALGCASTSRTHPPTTRPTTARADDGNRVTATDFDRLWNICADVARDRLFTIDRQDFRKGVLTTEALVSAQFFEPWRRDALTADAVAESSLASIRRTIRFEFTRNEDSTFSVVPHVQVERQSVAERRLTSASAYRVAFRRNMAATGTRESDRGVQLPSRYWYRTGTDPVLEKALADAIRRRV